TSRCFVAAFARMRASIPHSGECGYKLKSCKRTPCGVALMCGRFTLTATGDALAELFQLLKPPDWSPRYNIAPTQPIPVIRRQVGGGRYCSLLRWGLVPSWAREIKGPPLINARAEGIADKPAFRTALCQRRCLIPADSFYEWRGQGRKKQAF